MLDGDTPAGYTTLSATSSLPGTNPEDALLSSDKPDLFWSPNPEVSGDPVLTVDVTSDTPATVSEIELVVDDVLAVEVVINTPDGPYTPVRF